MKSYYCELLEQRVLVLGFRGKWTPDDFSNAITEAHDLITRAGVTAYDIIVDSTESSGFPRGNMLPNFQRAARVMNPAEQVIMVGTSPFGQQLVSIAVRLDTRWHERVSFTSNREDAYQKLDIAPH